MLYHASRLTNSSSPFLSVLQLAAGRAWARTATGGCAMHMTSVVVNPGNGGATSEDSSSIKDSCVYSGEEAVGSVLSFHYFRQLAEARAGHRRTSA